MKISEAMRIGARLTEPTTHAFFDFKGDTILTCAMGAALYGKDRSYLNNQPPLDKAFPDSWCPTTSPVTGCPYTVAACVVNLNDTHGWSREKIADWLETIGH